MHIAFLWNSVPHAEGGGGMVSVGMVQAMLRAGHRVTICVLMEPESIRPQHMPQLEELQSSNVTITEIPVPPRASWRFSGFRRLAHRFRVLLRPRNADFHPLVTQAQTVGAILAPLKPDVIIVFQVIEALHGVPTAPKMALLGAMEHLTHLYWWRVRATWRAPIRTVVMGIRALLVSFLVRRWNLRMLADYQRVGVLGAQDAVWLRQHGITNALYLPAPIQDPGQASWKSRRAGVTSGEDSGVKPKIILVGHVQAVPTLAGLYFFGRHILPGLERSLGAEAFEVHIIGRYSLPRPLARAFDKPSVRLRGFVEDIDGEFLTSDILCVPTPIDFSMRVRICVGFSFGCCVVAHHAIAAGMPELIHDYNVLMAGDGPGLVSQIVRALRDERLRVWLGANARRTYEERFSAGRAGQILLDELERIRGGPSSEAIHPSEIGAGFCHRKERNEI